MKHKFLNFTLLSLLVAAVFFSMQSQAAPYGESTVRFCTIIGPVPLPNPFELVESKIYDTRASTTYLRLNLQSKHWYTTALSGGASNLHNDANTSRFKNNLLVSHNIYHPYHELGYPAKIWHVETWGLFEACGPRQYGRMPIRRFYEVAVDQHGCGSTTKKALGTS